MEKVNKVVFVSLVLFLIFTSRAIAVSTKSVSSPYLFTFNQDGSLPEASDLSLSWSPYWWVNSGGYMKINGGSGSTVMGSLAGNDYWRTLYARNNPTDTDNGYHPQNIFRLVTRTKWGNAQQEAYFNIAKDNLSSSSNRNASNGLLLFNRYQGGDTLYYTGVRVDGKAVIKKKKNGTYYTMALTDVFPGSYNRSSNPNLIPKNQWIGLRSVVKNLTNGAVKIDLYMDQGRTGSWKLIASATDNGTSYGGGAITESGYGGIRTDFMDVQFDNFRLTSL